MLSWLADDRDSTCCPSRFNRICSQLFNKQSYSASLLLRDSLHINLCFPDHDTKIFSVFYTYNCPKSNLSCPKMSFYNTYYTWQLSLSTHDHDTRCLWEIFSLSTNISVAIKFSQRWYCTKDSWKINSSPVATWQNISFVMLHIFPVHTKIFRILLSLCNSAWQNIHSCIENVKIFSYVTKNMCNVTKDVFRTALLLIQKFSRIILLTIVTIYQQFILKYLYLSSGQQLKNQPTTAVAASASAAAEPGSSSWLSPAK